MAVVQLLDEIRKRHPEGVVGTGGKTLVYEVGRKNRDSDVLEMLEEADPSDMPGVLIVDLAGITVLTPSAASAVAGGASRIVQDRTRPVVFINAQPEVFYGLQDCRYMRDHPTPPLVVFDVVGEVHYIGAVPDRWKLLLGRLPSGGASASSLAGETAASRREVNKYSVYLQELYSNGLAWREKVPASDREGSERGWTYRYYPVPDDVDLLMEMGDTVVGVEFKTGRVVR